MKNLLSIELYKLRTTPAAWVSLALTIAFSAASVVLNVFTVNPGGPALGSPEHVSKALSVSAMTSMVMLAIGVIMVAGEYRNRTIMQTFLGEPRRAKVLVAKAVTALGLGTVLGAGTFGLGYLEAMLVYGARGVESLPVDVTQLWVGATVSTALYGLVGIALGALTRNTVAAIIGAMGWILVVEIGILANVIPDYAQWLPGGAAVALTSVHSATGGLSPTTAGLVLAGWAVAIAAVAARFSLSREAH